MALPSASVSRPRVVASEWPRSPMRELQNRPETIHTDLLHFSPLKQNIPSWSAIFAPSSPLLPHSSSFISHPSSYFIQPSSTTLFTLLFFSPLLFLSSTPPPPPSSTLCRLDPQARAAIGAGEAPRPRPVELPPPRAMPPFLHGSGRAPCPGAPCLLLPAVAGHQIRWAISFLCGGDNILGGGGVELEPTSSPLLPHRCDVDLELAVTTRANPDLLPRRLPPSTASFPGGLRRGARNRRSSLAAPLLHPPLLFLQR
jgi:hypothetical protein